MWPLFGPYALHSVSSENRVLTQLPISVTTLRRKGVERILKGSRKVHMLGAVTFSTTYNRQMATYSNPNLMYNIQFKSLYH